MLKSKAVFMFPTKQQETVKIHVMKSSIKIKLNRATYLKENRGCANQNFSGEPQISLRKTFKSIFHNNLTSFQMVE